MKKLLPLLILLITGFSSCSEESSDSIQGVPFQEKKDGKWSMISTDNGKIIFSNKFQSPPTMAVDGRFMVKNKKNLWEIYSAEKKPKKIGKEYVSATCFHNGHALVAEPNKPVSIIDKDGQTVRSLEKIEGNVVTGVAELSEGYAVYTTGDNNGVIDADGRPVIPAQYCNINNCSDGKFVAVDKKYAKNFQGEDNSDYSFTVLDTSGKKLCNIQRSKYDWIGGSFQSGLLEVSVKKGNKDCWGVINETGKEVIVPTEKIPEIADIKGDRLIYSHDALSGLMNLKQEILIHPKYERLIFDGDNLLACTHTGKEEDNRYIFIDENGQKLFHKEFLDAYTFDYFGGKHTVVMIADNKFALIDKEGKAVEKQPKMWNVNFYTGDSYIASDYMDLDALVAALGITPNGIDGLSFTSPIQKIIAQYAKNSDTGLKEHPKTDPYWYDMTKELDYSKEFNSISVTINIAFPSEISRQTYTMEETDDENEKYEERATGYAFNDIQPSALGFYIGITDRIQNKMPALYRKICAKFRQMGRIVKENADATIFAMNNGCTALILKDTDSVSAIWGKDIDLSRFSVSKYTASE